MEEGKAFQRHRRENWLVLLTSLTYLVRKEIKGKPQFSCIQYLQDAKLETVGRETSLQENQESWIHWIWEVRGFTSKTHYIQGLCLEWSLQTYNKHEPSEMVIRYLCLKNIFLYLSSTHKWISWWVKISSFFFFCLHLHCNASDRIQDILHLSFWWRREMKRNDSILWLFYHSTFLSPIIYSHEKWADWWWTQGVKINLGL